MTSSSTGSDNSPKNYYDLLGIKPTASAQEIRQAYWELSKLYHPDTTELSSAIATQKFQALNAAYGTLSLSAGEIFALFILGLTFAACLALVFILGIADSDFTLPTLTS